MRRSGTTTIAATQAGRRDDYTQAKNGTHAPMERTRPCPGAFHVRIRDDAAGAWAKVDVATMS